MSLIYLALGILTGCIGTRIWQAMAQCKLRFSWYHWMSLALWYPSVLGLVAFIVTSLEEREPQAAGMALLIFGGALLILSLLTYRIVFKPRIFIVQSPEV